MKRLASFLLAILLLLSVVGCGAPDTPDTSADVTTTTSATVQTESSDPDGHTTDTDPSDTTVVPTAGTDAPAADTTHRDTDTETVTATNPTGKTTQTVTTTTVTKKTETVTQRTTRSTVTATQKTTVTTTTTTATTGKTTLSLSPQHPLVDRVFALTGNATLQATLTGPVVSVKEAYTDRYGNASFTIQVEGTDGVAQDLYCYRCKPANGSAKDIAVGQTVTVSGTVKNYKGTIEFDKGTYTVGDGSTPIVTTTTTRAPFNGTVEEDGIYDSAEEVALYIHTYGKLPKNYITKSQYNNSGKPRNKCCGGDRFYNKEGLLPSKAGRLYYECDIDTYGITSRGAKRIVYSNDGLIYYTGDHYASFTLMYGEP